MVLSLAYSVPNLCPPNCTVLVCVAFGLLSVGITDLTVIMALGMFCVGKSEGKSKKFYKISFKILIFNSNLKWTSGGS